MKIKFLISGIFLLVSQLLFAQITTGELTGEVNTITTAVPFLTIAVDSRAGAMGDAGVATLPDANSQHHNPAKYMFMDKDVGMSISYTPWLRKLINDINLGYLTGYKKFGDKQVVSTSLRYFSLGNITFTDIMGSVTGQFKPNEFAVDLAYTRLYTRHLSGSVAMRYIYSNLTGGQLVQTTSTHAGNALAADVAVYYYKPIEINKKDAIVTAGLNISNIGTKISYTSNDEKNFIPTTMKLGVGLSVDLDEYNSIAFTGQVEKLLVPTPPVYYKDSLDAEGNPVIEYGKDPYVSVPVGIFQSFYDAPGVAKDPLYPDDRSVMREEIREFNYSLGVEYWYAKQFAVRAGYFHEHPTKGNREFFTVGLGLRLNVFGLDFSYLIPTYQQNPLENTLRFSLLFNFAGLEEKNAPQGE